MSSRKLAINLAGCTGAVLLVLVVVSLVTGATQEAHEHYALPEAYAISLLEHANALRIVFALDVAFLVLYTGFFAALANYLAERGRPFVRIALGAMIATAILDIIEDHHIVSLLDAAEQGMLPSPAAIGFQVVESACKFSMSYLALFMFGLAIPRDTRLGFALAIFLTAGSLLSAIFAYSMTQTAMATFDQWRWITFVGGFGLAIAWLLKSPDAPSSAGVGGVVDATPG